MAVLASNIKFYKCSVWAEGSSHGGDIDLAEEIESAVDQNVFDDVSNAERIAGDTEYRKVYIRNENAGSGSDWEYIKAWISQFTPASNDEIWITASGSNEDTQASAEGYEFVQPSGKADPDYLDLGTLQTSGYHHIWIKRVVDAAGAGYSGNNFKLTFESS